MLKKNPHSQAAPKKQFLFRYHQKWRFGRSSSSDMKRSETHLYLKGAWLGHVTYLPWYITIPTLILQYRLYHIVNIWLFYPLNLYKKSNLTQHEFSHIHFLHDYIPFQDQTNTNAAALN